ncbi:hypothetical protein [Shouchella shacheensis]|uniref:hypothetical protein n=1 Tax=Shouchella shacheensis TaxID=1649580 RepID=UPI000740166F|nr:hypothetical protein [Shouchella shacheensis]
MTIPMINLLTGEKIPNVVSFRTEEQQLAWLKDKKRRQALEKQGSIPFIACYHTPIQTISSKLSLTEAGALFNLLFYVPLNAGGRLSHNGQALTQQDIQRIIGRKLTQTKAILKKLEQVELLLPEKEGRKKTYRINEHFHRRGTLSNQLFTKVIYPSERSHIHALPLTQAGLLYKLLPYIHYHTNIIVSNPNEEDETKIQPMTREELAKAIQHSPTELTKLMQALHARKLILTSSYTREQIYTIHPDLMYRKNSDGQDFYTSFLRHTFLFIEENPTR